MNTDWETFAVANGDLNSNKDEARGAIKCLNFSRSFISIYTGTCRAYIASFMLHVGDWSLSTGGLRYYINGAVDKRAVDVRADV